MYIQLPATSPNDEHAAAEFIHALVPVHVCSASDAHWDTGVRETEFFCFWQDTV